GGFGYELALLSHDFLGWGTFILIFGSLLIFVIFFFNIDQLNWFSFSSHKSNEPDEEEGEMAVYELPEDKKDKTAVEHGMEDNDPEDDLEVDESQWTIKSDTAKSRPV